MTRVLFQIFLVKFVGISKLFFIFAFWGISVISFNMYFFSHFLSFHQLKNAAEDDKVMLIEIPWNGGTSTTLINCNCAYQQVSYFT